MILVLLFVAIYGVHAVISVWAFIQLRRFLAATPTLADETSLQRYKDLVRVQMYVTLAVGGLLVGGIILSVLLILRYGCMGFVLVTAGNAWLFAAGLFIRSWEVRARGLSAGSEELAREYRRVSETWVKKALPDF
jgi:hypothetical protein